METAADESEVWTFSRTGENMTCEAPRGDSFVWKSPPALSFPISTSPTSDVLLSDNTHLHLVSLPHLYIYTAVVSKE